MPQLPAFGVEGRRSASWRARGRRSASWRARRDRFEAMCRRDASFAERLLQVFFAAVGVIPLVMRAGAERTITSGEPGSCIYRGGSTRLGKSRFDQQGQDRFRPTMDLGAGHVFRRQDDPRGRRGLVVRQTRRVTCTSCAQRTLAAATSGARPQSRGRVPGTIPSIAGKSGRAGAQAGELRRARADIARGATGTMAGPDTGNGATPSRHACDRRHPPRYRSPGSRSRAAHVHRAAERCVRFDGAGAVRRVC